MFNHHGQDLDIINHKDDDEIGKLVGTATLSDKDNNRKVLVSWSQLDQDTLGEIMCKLSLYDQARFHAICKTWHATHPSTTTMTLPWFVTVEFRSVPAYYHKPPMHRLFCKPKPYYNPKPTKENDMIEFKIYDPSYHIHPRPLSVFTISLTQLFGISPSTCFNKYHQINLVKHGWFICTSEAYHKRSRNTRIHLALFSPLTKKVIKLPSLDNPFEINFILTFSTDPESPDCVFIILGDKSLATTCCGDNEWKFKKPDIFHQDMHFALNPVYVEGIFYIVSSRGQLVSYNTIDGEFKYESLLTDSVFIKHFSSHWPYNRYRMFMLDGELIVLFISHIRFYDDTLSCCIRKFDWTNKVWIPISDLGNHTLFVRNETASLVKVGKEAARNCDETLSNKLYFFGCGCRVYSLENGEFVNDADMMVERMYSSVFEGTDVRMKDSSIFWLEPPVIG